MSILDIAKRKVATLYLNQLKAAFEKAVNEHRANNGLGLPIKLQKFTLIMNIEKGTLSCLIFDKVYPIPNAGDLLGKVKEVANTQIPNGTKLNLLLVDYAGDNDIEFTGGVEYPDGHKEQVKHKL